MTLNTIQLPSPYVRVGCAAGAVVVAGCLWWACRANQPSPDAGPDDEFRVLSKEERYHLWVRGIEARVSNMNERLAVLQEADRGSLLEGGSNRKMFLQLDEDTTKCLIEVDGRDVDNNDALRAIRKDLVARLSVIAEATSQLVS